MGILQQASGVWTGTSFTPTLPGASDAANCVIVIVTGNTTVTTPTNWTLRTSQVNQMGHYLYDRQGASLTSIAMTCSAGQGMWYIAEIEGGSYQNALSRNDGIGLGTTCVTPALTPTAGTRQIIAGIGSLLGGGPVRTVSGWTNSFVETADAGQASADYPSGAIADLDDVAANGSTAYSTTGTYSQSSDGHTAIIASYVTGTAAVAIPPIIVMPPRRP